ncbi:uncharacterized protein LOC128712939 [Anopheles marshallii]|uniref:uncharacterized protein LOC128712939 n=1 Tax=Anopheles marshallii TaxID=1521116 RepID=UPI00237B203D|nr:uncharacterized protein LOC128712939 [Anopheles marshallii]
MHSTALGRVCSLVVIALIQVFAIVDFNFDDDPKSDAQFCCMVEHTFPQEPFRTCYEQHKNSPDNNETAWCIHQCYYNAIGMFSNGDKLEIDNYLQYKDSLDAARQDPFTFALAVCVKLTIKLIKHFAASGKELPCSPIPYLFNRCLMEVDMVNCPLDQWLNSTFCDALTKKIKSKYGEGIRYDEVKRTSGNPSDR